MSWGLSDLERRLAALVKIGKIEVVDHEKRQIKVAAGGMSSAWLPWPCEIGRNFKRWRPLRVSQQVVMIAPSGELAQAVVVGMLYSGDLDAPSGDPDVDVIAFDDGARVEYNSATGHMTLKAMGSVTVDAQSVRMTGDVQIDGSLHTDGDTVAGSVSLKEHTHGGVATGGGNTSNPN